ncbi:MAG: prenyltransferase [Betaproteobacteria bacterium]|nr:MAG: prenyltransferase [Betaproteobacteria bacterium]
MEQHQLTALVRSARIPFLMLTPVSIFLGVCTSFVSAGQIAFFDLFLVLLGAVFAHISVNTFNEYFDFRSGLDATTLKTPFSGGSGALLDHPEAVDRVLWLAIASLSITIIVGFYFVFTSGILIVPLGIAGVLIILTYTQWLNRYPFLCLVAPGLGFGPLMVVGTHVVLTGGYSIQAFVASLVPFFLANNLLLLNQYPDIAPDKRVGRRHFPIAFGVTTSTLVYGAFVVATCATIVTGASTQILPEASYLALVPMTLALVVFFGALKHATSVGQLMPYLAMNVLVTVLTPIVLGMSIIPG